MRARSAAVAISLALLLPGVGAAHDHSPPNAVLRIAGSRQEGSSYHGDWTARAGPDSCVAMGWIGTGEQDMLQVPPGFHDARIRLRSRYRPEGATVTVYDAVLPVGPTTPVREAVEYRLVPKRRGGRVVAWDLRFEIAGGPDRYLDVHAEWRDRDGCGGTQDVDWRFRFGFVAS